MSEDILSKPAPAADARIPYGPDPSQFFDLRLPKLRRPTYPLLINIHGGYWRAKYGLDHAGHLCAALAATGIATANLEYRRVGNEGGGWPGTFEDSRNAFHFLLQNAAKHGFDSSNVAIMGHSAGDQLALCLTAHEPHIKRVTSLAGVLDLPRAYELPLSHDAVVDFLGGTPTAVPAHYRQAVPMQLSIPHAKQWIIQG